MTVKQLIFYLESDGIDPNSEVFYCGLNKSYTSRTITKVGKLEDLGNHIVLIPGKE